MSRFAVVSLVAVALLSGCAGPAMEESEVMAVKREGIVDEGGLYESQPTLAASLFRSDQAVMDDEAVRRALASHVVLRARARIALMKFPGAENAALRFYGSFYWRSEDYLKTQQTYIDTVSCKLTASERVAEVILLPSLLTPKEATIPVLREAAVRLQADLLLVFRPTSDIYYPSKIFTRDQVKAYCTCEAVLLDVRTGLIPFTTVITRDRSDQKEKEDLDLNETMRRAESAAVLDSLNALSDQLVTFLAGIPRTSEQAPCDLSRSTGPVAGDCGAGRMGGSPVLRNCFLGISSVPGVVTCGKGPRMAPPCRRTPCKSTSRIVQQLDLPSLTLYNMCL
jgi:hypothetical protein